MNQKWIVARRDFLKITGFTALAPNTLAAAEPKNIVRFGLVTDSHYADANPNGSRYYRESLAKMKECIECMNENQVDFVMELGDFKDQNTPPVEEKTLLYLQKIENVYGTFQGPRYHVIGNHDCDSLSKPQLLTTIQNTGIPKDRSYYSFDTNGLHFIVLDANFKSDGAPYNHGNFNWTDANISAEELDWLKTDLSQTTRPTMVFTHQLLDGSGNVYINNAKDVRHEMEQSGKVLAVFQGHHHAGSYRKIQNIHYYTLKAMVEGSGEQNSSYAIVSVRENGRVEIEGYRRAVARDFQGQRKRIDTTSHVGNK